MVNDPIAFFYKIFIPSRASKYGLIKIPSKILTITVKRLHCSLADQSSSLLT